MRYVACRTLLCHSSRATLLSLKRFCLALHCTSLHYAATSCLELRCRVLRCAALTLFALRYPVLRLFALRYPALHKRSSLALHCRASYYLALPCPHLIKRTPLPCAALALLLGCPAFHYCPVLPYAALPYAAFPCFTILPLTKHRPALLLASHCPALP